MKSLLKPSVRMYNYMKEKKERFVSSVRRITKDESGSIWTEYGLLIAIAVIVAVAVLWFFKDDIVRLFNDARSQLRVR